MSLSQLLFIVSCNALLSVQAVPLTDIVGGSSVNFMKYPWMGYLRQKSNETDFNAQFCGASAIGSHHILTAAHCVQSLTKDDIQAVFGEFSLDDKTGIHYDIELITAYPNYTAEDHSGDVAVLKTSQALAVPLLAQLNDDPLLSNGEVQQAIGWGRLTPDLWSGGDQFSQLLHETQLQMMPKSMCNDVALKFNTTFTDKMMCAYSAGRDTCFGDSGGPIFVMKDGVPVITGITSFALPSGYYSCAVEDEPGYYADVCALRLWIESQMI